MEPSEPRKPSEQRRRWNDVSFTLDPAPARVGSPIRLRADGAPAPWESPWRLGIVAALVSALLLPLALATSARVHHLPPGWLDTGVDQPVDGEWRGGDRAADVDHP